MIIRHLPGCFEYLSNVSNHNYINEKLKEYFSISYNCSFIISKHMNPAYIWLRLNVGDDDYDLLTISMSDMIDSVALTDAFFDRYYSFLKQMLRIDTIDQILKDISQGHQEVLG